MTEANDPEAPLAGLTEDDIVTRPEVGRRRFLLLGALGGTAALGGCGPVPTGITDADTGAGADPSSFGRGNTGLTDRDSGPGADPAGSGRGPGFRRARRQPNPWA